MNYFLLISLILAAVSSLFALSRQLQMLQQNSYYPSRYFGWLKDNLPYLDVFLFFISALLFVFGWFLPQTIFNAALLAFRIPYYLDLQKKSIKKLVFTPRVKRLFAAAILVQIVLILLYALNYRSVLGRLSMDLSFTLSYLSPFMIFIIWCLTYPIEKAFNLWFINDAKKRLKAYSKLKVIGITGSYGKTSTKFILTRILSEKFNVVCTPKSYNTTMGVVRTIRENFKPQTEVFICEMGAKNKGDIKEICNIASPDYGIITSVGKQHLETFKSVDNVFKTKFELADAVTAKNGTVFVNGDSEDILSRVNKEDYFVYGSQNEFDCKIENIVSGRYGSEFTLKLKDTELKLSTKLLGRHSILNIAGAAALAHSLGVDEKDIRFAVASLKPYEHRLELKVGINQSLLIDDAYNANPEGSLEAVNVLGTFEGMQKVIITPGLIELGDKEYDCNRNLGEAAGRVCDKIILVGQNRSKPLAEGVNSTDFNKENLFVASSFAEAMKIYSKFANSKTVLLIENDLPDNYLN